MNAPVPYLSFDGTASDALTFYARVFGGEVQAHTFAEFGRSDGPPERIAHGILRGPVELFAADVGADERPLRVEGVLFSLLGAAEPATLTAWFGALAEGGVVVDPLQKRPWGAWDGLVTDRFGVPWLLGYEQ
jgi:PhnB protein